MTVAPDPRVPERGVNVFESDMAPSMPGNKGPLRFEEGLATDTDVPSDFQRGAYFDTMAAPGTDHDPNPEMVFKHAADTMRERAHPGSASWVEAPSVLSEFVDGAAAGNGPLQEFQITRNPGTHMNRPSAFRVNG